MKGKVRKLWICPRCGRKFANRNQWHSCGRYSVKEFLKGKSKIEISLYRKFIELVKKLGSAKIAPAKTRIGFQKRMIFAAINGLSKDRLKGHIVLSRKIESKRFVKIETIPPKYYVRHFVIGSIKELDKKFFGLLKESYTGRNRNILDKDRSVNAEIHF